MSKEIVSRKTEGTYVIQEMVDGKWEDVSPTSSDLKEAKWSLERWRRTEVLSSHDFRLVYKRVETTYELEVDG